MLWYVLTTLTHVDQSPCPRWTGEWSFAGFVLETTLSRLAYQPSVQRHQWSAKVMNMSNFVTGSADHYSQSPVSVQSALFELYDPMQFIIRPFSSHVRLGEPSHVNGARDEFDTIVHTGPHRQGARHRRASDIGSCIVTGYSRNAHLGQLRCTAVIGMVFSALLFRKLMPESNPVGRASVSRGT